MARKVPDSVNPLEPVASAIGDAVEAIGDFLTELSEAFTGFGTGGGKLRKPAKGWSDLSPAYRKRMERKGLNARNWNTAQGARLRQEARGHKATPEHPQRAKRQPERYREYLDTRDEVVRKVMAHKRLIFGDRIKYRERGSNSAVRLNPKTGEPPNLKLMRKFLTMTADDIDTVDWWRDDDWAFLFYH